MALSDYLTSEEWDACFYLWSGEPTSNFGESMHKTISLLLGKGYRFAGLDEQGNKSVQVRGGINAPKLCIFIGNPHKVDVVKCLDNGRDFFKRHAPDLISETDEVWTEQMMDKQQRQVLRDSARTITRLVQMIFDGPDSLVSLRTDHRILLEACRALAHPDGVIRGPLRDGPELDALNAIITKAREGGA